MRDVLIADASLDDLDLLLDGCRSAASHPVEHADQDGFRDLDVVTGGNDMLIGHNGGNTINGLAGFDSIVGTTVAYAGIGDRLLMEGADPTTMQVETAAGSTILRAGNDLAVTLDGSFEVSQFQVGSGVTILQAAASPPPPPDLSIDPAAMPPAPSANGFPAGFNALAYIASYPDLIAAFGTDTEAATQHYLQHGQAEGRTVTFDPLGYIASYPDLIAAFGTDTEAATGHYIESGYGEGRAPNFNGLAYIASYPDLSAVFGTDADAGTRHFIEYGAAEGRSASFDGYNYLAANPDVTLAYGIDANAATQHYIRFGQAEGRPAQGFDALRYIASNPDLIQAFGPDVQAAEIHYAQFGRNEGRSLTAFDPQAYLASHPEIAAEFGTSDVAVELAYIKRSTSTETAAMAASDGEVPIAIAMLAAGMTGSETLGIDGAFHDVPSSAMASGLLAAGDGGLSTRQRTELPV